MIKQSIRSLLCTLMVCVVFISAGCEDDKKSSPTVNVTGTWHVSADDGSVAVVTLNQSEDGSVTAVARDGWGRITNGYGLVSGNRLSLILYVNGGRTDFVMSIEGNNASGIFKDSDGSKGTLVAVRR